MKLKLAELPTLSWAFRHPLHTSANRHPSFPEQSEIRICSNTEWTG